MWHCVKVNFQNIHTVEKEREVLAVLLFPSFYINKQKRKWSYLTWKTQMDVGTWKRKVSRTDETVLEIGRYILTKDCSLTSQKLVGICNKTHILLQWDLKKRNYVKKKNKNFASKIDLRLGQSIRNLLTLMDIIWLAKFNTIIFRKDDDNILASSIFLCILFWTQLPWRPSSQR